VRGTIGVFSVDDKGQLKAEAPIRLPPPIAPRGEDAAESDAGPQQPGKAKAKAAADGKNAAAGLAIDAQRGALWAVFNMRNSLAQVDLGSGQIAREIRVGNAPYGVVLVGNQAYVSNWAGREPGKGNAAADSGTAAPVRVDPVRHIASDGSVSVVDLDAG